MANPAPWSRLWMLAQQAEGNLPPAPPAQTWRNYLPDPRLMPPIRVFDVDPNSPVQPAPMELPQSLPAPPYMPVSWRR